MLNSYTELFPVLLAVVAAVMSTHAYSRADTKYLKLAFLFATLSSVLLILGQTSWWTQVTSKFTDDPFWIYLIWKIFDITVFISLIYTALDVIKKKA